MNQSTLTPRSCSSVAWDLLGCRATLWKLFCTSSKAAGSRTAAQTRSLETRDLLKKNKKIMKLLFISVFSWFYITFHHRGAWPWQPIIGRSAFHAPPVLVAAPNCTHRWQWPICYQEMLSAPVLLKRLSNQPCHWLLESVFVVLF